MEEEEDEEKGRERKHARIFLNQHFVKKITSLILNEGIIQSV